MSEDAASNTLGRLFLVGIDAAESALGRSAAMDGRIESGIWEILPEFDFQDLSIDLRTPAFLSGGGGPVAAVADGDGERFPSDSGATGCGETLPGWIGYLESWSKRKYSADESPLEAARDGGRDGVGGGIVSLNDGERGVPGVEPRDWGCGESFPGVMVGSGGADIEFLLLLFLQSFLMLLTLTRDDDDLGCAPF